MLLVSIFMPPKGKSKSASKTKVKVKGKSKVRKSAPIRRAFNASSGAGRSVGRMIGNAIAPGIGGAVGGYVGEFAGRISGMGSYKIKHNTLATGPTPEFGDRSIRIRNREFIANVGSTTAFTLSSFNLNPGLNGTFPWLSTIAANYEEYEFNGLIFEFVTTTGTAISGSSAAMGQIIMATDYDSLDDPFSSGVQMMAAMFSNTGVPYSNLLHAVECDPSQRPAKVMYIRSGPVSSGDLRLYDLGVFGFATQNQQSNAAGLGLLWVSYDVVLRKPTFGFNNPADSVPTQMMAGASSGVNWNLNLASTMYSDPEITLPWTYGANTINFPINDNNCYIMALYAQSGQSGGTINPTFHITNAVATYMRSNSTFMWAIFTTAGTSGSAPYVVFPNVSVGTSWTFMICEANNYMMNFPLNAVTPAPHVRDIRIKTRVILEHGGLVRDRKAIEGKGKDSVSRSSSRTRDSQSSSVSSAPISVFSSSSSSSSLTSTLSARHQPDDELYDS